MSYHSISNIIANTLHFKLDVYSLTGFVFTGTCSPSIFMYVEYVDLSVPNAFPLNDIPDPSNAMSNILTQLFSWIPIIYTNSQHQWQCCDSHNPSHKHNDTVHTLFKYLLSLFSPQCYPYIIFSIVFVSQQYDKPLNIATGVVVNLL